MNSKIFFSMRIFSRFKVGSEVTFPHELHALIDAADRDTDRKLGSPLVASPQDSIDMRMDPAFSMERRSILGMDFFEHHAKQEEAYRNGRIDALTDLIMMDLTRANVRELVAMVFNSEMMR